MTTYNFIQAAQILGVTLIELDVLIANGVVEVTPTSEEVPGWVVDELLDSPAYLADQVRK